MILLNMRYGMKNYDWLIVGAGLFGSVFAYELKKMGKKCLVIDKRNHAGGNLYCEKVADINVHRYGAHIFHTSNVEVWDYINQFASFNRYINSPVAVYRDKLYNLPFNMNTFYQLWGTVKPCEARSKIAEQVQLARIGEPKNLEEQALSLVGPDIYNKLIKGYTEKQWGRDAKELPAFIIRRIPIRFNFNNDYFNDTYQGIPIGGYNKLFDKWLADMDVCLGENFFNNRGYWLNKAGQVLFTGMIDQFYDYQYGKLEYRSLRFDDEILNTDNFQGNAVVNYTDRNIPFTRIIEHKHFEFGKQNMTIITREYPEEWKEGSEPYYPINNKKNQIAYAKYRLLASEERKVLVGGRLGEYKYYDMHDIIEQALKLVKGV